jgi:hypothetical protein
MEILLFSMGLLIGAFVEWMLLTGKHEEEERRSYCAGRDSGYWAANEIRRIEKENDI